MNTPLTLIGNMKLNKDKKTSCGMLIRCGKRYLVVHATKTWAPLRVDDGYWGYPKGGLDEGETPMACAIRELQEETGINLKHKVNKVFLIREYPGKKKNFVLFGYVDEDQELMNHIFQCESMVPATKDFDEFPEVDSWYWATKVEVHQLMHGVHKKKMFPMAKRKKKKKVEKDTDV